MDLRKQLLLLLSGPDISDRQFDAFCRSLQGDGLPKILSQAQQIRSILSDTSSDIPSPNKHFAETRHYGPEVAPVIDEVSKLLISEAHLSKAAAIQALLERLPFGDHLPTRIPFESALVRIADSVGPMQVLNAARAIRNEISHQSSASEWPLRGAT